VIDLDGPFLQSKKNVNKPNSKRTSNFFAKGNDVSLLKEIDGKYCLVRICIGKFYRLTKQGMSGEEALAKLNRSSKKSSQADDDEDFSDESLTDDDDDDDDDEGETS
jgi:hypothetical protein